MVKKILSLVCFAVLAMSIVTGCNSTSTDNKKVTSATTATTKKAVIKDADIARVGTIKDFLKYRSITLNKKVLRFYLNDTQMKYVGFNITDTTGLENILVGGTAENVEYTSDNGMTAYVSMKNTSNVNTDYTKCKYYTLTLIKGDCKDVELLLPNKLGWDSTVDKIKKNYGEPISETQDENGNTVLLYGEDVQEYNEGYTIQLTINESGISVVEIELHDVTE
ncbi:MAG: hypothetical protein UIM53_02035 [Acutalibacteraceae bacterium]|nr:hypothetical protein [Acutalibacteraceae bacterium]